MNHPSDTHTDLAGHRIEGYVQGDKIDIPLISHIADNLWVGGCQNGYRLPVDFKYVLSLYRWEEYTLPLGCSRVTATMYDSADMPDEALLYGLATLAGTMVESGKTLIHCQAGLNRSNLITALMLITVKGMTPKAAIELLRETRSSLVLCNTTFEGWLKAQARN